MSVTRREVLAIGLASAMLGVAYDAGAARASAWARRKRTIRVHGRDMAYVEVGRGAPIVFLHGNPTSSYLWRNILPHVRHLGRCIAPDLIGMGDSEKLPGSEPGRYSFHEHQHYLYGLLDALRVDQDVILVLHDWGSALGLSWAQHSPGRVRAIAYMEAIIEVPGAPTPPAPPGSFSAKVRSPQGEQLILEENGFVEGVVSALRPLVAAPVAAGRRAAADVSGRQELLGLAGQRQRAPEVVRARRPGRVDRELGVARLRAARTQSIGGRRLWSALRPGDLSWSDRPRVGALDRIALDRRRLGSRNCGAAPARRFRQHPVSWPGVSSPVSQW